MYIVELYCFIDYGGMLSCVVFDIIDGGMLWFKLVGIVLLVVMFVVSVVIYVVVWCVVVVLLE